MGEGSDPQFHQNQGSPVQRRLDSGTNPECENSNNPFPNTELSISTNGLQNAEGPDFLKFKSKNTKKKLKIIRNMTQAEKVT